MRQERKKFRLQLQIECVTSSGTGTYSSYTLYGVRQRMRTINRVNRYQRLSQRSHRHGYKTPLNNRSSRLRCDRLMLSDWHRGQNISNENRLTHFVQDE